MGGRFAGYTWRTCLYLHALVRTHVPVFFLEHLPKVFLGELWVVFRVVGVVEFDEADLGACVFRAHSGGDNYIDLLSTTVLFWINGCLMAIIGHFVDLYEYER